jgi:hypothetical protein
MTRQEFKDYIATRMAAERLDELAAEFGVSRQTLYNWRDGQPPSRMAITLIEKTSQ